MVKLETRNREAEIARQLGELSRIRPVYDSLLTASAFWDTQRVGDFRAIRKAMEGCFIGRRRRVERAIRDRIGGPIEKQ